MAVDPEAPGLWEVLRGDGRPWQRFLLYAFLLVVLTAFFYLWLHT